MTADRETLAAIIDPTQFHASDRDHALRLADAIIAAGWAPRVDAELTRARHKDLDDLRALSDAATDGPWTYRESVAELNPESDDDFTYVRHNVYGDPWDTGKDEPYVAETNGAPDGEFIAAAVNYVRATLDGTE